MLVTFLLTAVLAQADLSDAGSDLAAAAPVAIDAGIEQVTPPTTAEKTKAKALPKNFTGIIGRVTDSRSGEGLIEATIKVVSGPKKSALTDLDGNFRLKLPVGTYELRVFYELYEGRRISNVVVTQGKATELNVELQSDSKAVQEVVVEAKVDKRNESALLQERKKAVVVSDSVGAQEIARTPDSNAGDAVKRVVSATVVDGKYVFLRGLGGRYAQTLLNGTILPSPEPDEPSVPLDLFPVALVSNLNVLKTYSSDLPATFGGGSLTIDTNTFPTKMDFRVRAQLAGDTVGTFRARPADGMTFLENLGARSHFRDLPAAIPQDGPLINRPGFTTLAQENAGRSFINSWEPKMVTGLPSGTLSAQWGTTLTFAKEMRLGLLAAAQVSRKERVQRVNVQDVTSDNETLIGVNPTSSTIGSTQGATSALLNAGLQLNRDNEINYLGLALVNAESTSTLSTGFDQQAISNFESSRLSFTQRQLIFNQVKGFHRLNFLGDMEIDWQANYAHVNRSEPDVRDIRKFVGDDGLERIRFQPNSAERFFLDLGEDSGGATVNATIPIRNLRIKVGGLFQSSSRGFDARRFRLMQLGRLDPALQTLSPNELFVPGRIGPYTAGTNFFLEETTLTFDRYTASLSVWGGYAQADWRVTDWFRAIAGIRYEGSSQTLNAGSPFATGGAPVNGVERSYNDPIPSANLIFTPKTNLNIRLAYASTIARPTFRELAPFLFFDALRRRNVTGNPNLVETHIHHGDARVEWFPSENEVLAFTAFGKQFIDPIERVIVTAASTNDLGYRNSKGATLLGLELEARTSLGRLTPKLQGVRVGTNLSLIYSRIQIDDAGTQSLQSSNARPLQGQSPFVFNAFVTWEKPEWGTELGLFYNVYGSRISEVGVLRIPDVYEQPFHRLDATVTQRLGRGFQLKVSAANVLNQSIRLQQGPIEIFRSPQGVQFSATLSWNLETERK